MLARSRQACWRPVLLALAALATFATAVPNGFVWIDHWQVESGGLIAHSLGELWAALREPLGSIPGWVGPAPYARPAVITLLSLIHAVAGLNPAAYHLVVVAMHVANVLLAYSILLTLSGAPATAFFAAGLFALHPLQTAAVSWISGIADPLFALCVLLAFRLQLTGSQRFAAAGESSSPATVLRSRLKTTLGSAARSEFSSEDLPGSSRRIPFSGRATSSFGALGTLLLRPGAVLSFAVALGAKETAMVFPLLLTAAYLLLPVTTSGQDSNPRRLRLARQLTVLLAPYLLLVALDVAYRHLVLGAEAMGGNWAGIALGTRLWTAPRLILSYLTLPLRFASLTVCDDYALSTGPDPASIAAAGAIILLLVAVALSLRRWPQLSFGILWMLVSLLPALNVVPILHYRADRFFYFPFIGWSLAVVTIAQWAANAFVPAENAARVRRWAVIAGSATLLVLASCTMRRNTLFADDRRLFEATVAVSPFCREAHTGLGDAYLRLGRADEAVAQYELARAPQPGRVSYVVLPKVLINLGMARLARRDYAAAEAAFTEAHQLQPGLLHPLFGLGVANLALGRTSTGVSWLEQAYARDATDPDVSFNLALGYDRLGRQAEASAIYRQYLAIAPPGRARELAQQRLQALTSAPSR